MHRFVWDLRYALPKELAGPGGSMRAASGLWAPPGRYTVRLTAVRKTLTQPLVVVKDPRLGSSITDADLLSQYVLARGIQAERVRVAAALREANALRTQIATLHKTTRKAPPALEVFAKALDRAAGPPVLAPGEEFFDTEEIAPTTLRRLATSLSGLQSAVESADAAPTPDALTGFAARRKLVDDGLARWRIFLAIDLPEANKSLEAAGFPPLKTD
jgi:hypothetical protein